MKRRAFVRSLIPTLVSGSVAGCCRFPDSADVPGIVYEGWAFGTDISISIAGVARAEAESLLAGVAGELARLESIFSLYDPQSPLRVLNRDGHLDDPPEELAECLAISGRVNVLTGGAFDPTVQPLWDLYENHFALRPGDSRGPEPEAIAEARSRIGWKYVASSPERIEFLRPNMSMTLNGIAPGYTADRVTGWLAARGVQHALADVGEFRALGARPDGSAWPVSIRAGGRIADQIGLIDTGLATSSGSGTKFDLVGRFHHLFDPMRAQFSDSLRTISVEAPTAALADALATAGGVMGSAQFRDAVAGEAGVRVREFNHKDDSGS